MILLIVIEESFKAKVTLKTEAVLRCVCPSSLGTDKAVFGSESFLITQHCDLNMLLAEVLTADEYTRLAAGGNKGREVINNLGP